jgi:hypothetical protein
MINIYNRKRPSEGAGADLITNKIGIKTNFTKYQDPTNEFSSEELKMSFWYVKNRALLYKIIVIGLAVINIGFIGFNFWKWGEYILGISAQQQLERSLASSVDYTGSHSYFAAQPIQVMRTHMFASRENKYDVVAELVNPNPRFLARFTYYFIINGTKTPSQKTFLLPGESRLAGSLGISNGLGGTPEVVLENITYQRISNHDIGDVAAWQTYRLNFQTTDFIFSKSLAQEGNNADAVRFKLFNASPYGFRNANFYVALLQNGQMVGILPLYLDRIDSLEIKNIDLRTFVPGLNISEIALYPIINIYDEGVYAN